MQPEGAEQPLERTLAILVKRQQRQAILIVLLASGLVGAFVAIAWSRVEVAHAQSTASTSPLRVRQLIVEDQNGVDRIWIGAPLPNPMVLGKRYLRNEKVYGMLILDGDGNERGGYGTFDSGNANVSVDSVGDKQGDLGTGPDGGPEMALQNGGENGVSITVKDTPQLRMTEQGQVVLEQPKPTAAKP